MRFSVLQQDIEQAEAWRLARSRVPLPFEVPWQFYSTACHCPVAIAIQRTLDNGDVTVGYNEAAVGPDQQYEIRVLDDGPDVGTRIDAWDHRLGMLPFEAELVPFS